jgi:uncharacterized membrane protein YeaQ/YmgE (transglycosylase-associated protein family)
MDVALIAVLFLEGICPPWWPHKWPPGPPPPPPWWIRLIVGGVGGVIGGWGIGQVLAVDLATDSGTLIALAGGLIGSVILVGIADLVMPGRAEA